MRQGQDFSHLFPGCCGIFHQNVAAMQIPFDEMPPESQLSGLWKPGWAPIGDSGNVFGRCQRQKIRSALKVCHIRTSGAPCFLIHDVGHVETRQTQFSYRQPKTEKQMEQRKQKGGGGVGGFTVRAFLLS